MADIIKIGNVSKAFKDDVEISPIKNIYLNANTDIFTVSNDERRIDLSYSEIATKHGTTTPKELHDYYLANGFFFDIGSIFTRLDNLENKIILGIWYELITITDSTDGATGALSPPTNAAIKQNGMAGITGVIYEAKNSFPTDIPILDTDPGTTEEWVAVDLDSLGNYTILGQLNAGETKQAAIVYQYHIPYTDYDPNFDLNFIPDFDTINVDQLNLFAFARPSLLTALSVNEDGKLVNAIFGDYIQFAFDNSISTTTSTTFQNKLNFVTNNIEAGNYVLFAGYGWNHDNNTNDFEARIMLGGVQQGELHKQEPKDSAGGDPTGTTQRYYVSRPKVLSLSAGIKTFDLEYRTDSAGDESSIWEAIFILFRLT